RAGLRRAHARRGPPAARDRLRAAGCRARLSAARRPGALPRGLRRARRRARPRPRRADRAPGAERAPLPGAQRGGLPPSWLACAPLRRRWPLLALALVVFLAISAVLARWLS